MPLEIADLGSEGTSLVGTLVLDFAINWGAWAVASLLKTELFYDAVGTLSFTTVVLSALFNGGHYHPRQVGVAVMILAWTWRLGSFLFFRTLTTGGDSRFDQVKTQPLKYWVYWTFQAIWVWVCSLPSIFVSASDRNPSLGPTDVIGVCLFVLGLGLETLADLQKFLFKRDPANKGKFISTGVWSWCRYPNYFGEMCVWWGIFLTAAKSLHEADYISISSPLFIMILLLFVSGIPIQEAQAKSRWGEDPEYLAYRTRTPLLLPLPKIFPSRS